MGSTVQRRWFVFGGGGTGGHLFPALAVVDAMRERDAGVDVSFYCTDRAVDRDVLGKAGVEAVPQAVHGFPSRPWRWPRFALEYRSAVRRCMSDFARRRPAAVIGAGGYASGPPVEAALRLGIPAYLLNPDAVPGRANRRFAVRGVAGVFAQWAVTREHLPAGAPVIVTGCPVRRAFTNLDREAAGGFLRSIGLGTDRRTLLVTGASQGARTINEAMIVLAAALPLGWQVVHLSGEADRSRVVSAYRDAGTEAAVLAFTDRMADAIAAADLIVSRAGASTLAEITAAGKASILLPYPYHRDQHQRHNGQVLVDAGAAAMIDDAKDATRNAAVLRPVLEGLMRDDARRGAMAEAARDLGRPDAAEVIAERLLSAAQKLREPACETPSDTSVKTFARRTA